MASINKKAKNYFLEDEKISPLELLTRTCAAAMLWENTFYEDGESVVDRVNENISKLTKEEFKQLLKVAKEDNKLRHMPLQLLVSGAPYGLVQKSDVTNTITRVDDMTELLALYWAANEKRALPMAFKKGLKEAFSKFDEYQFAKYRGLKKEVKLRDVVRIVHPVPTDTERAALYGRIVNDELATPDTWEVELSKTDDKFASWSRLVKGNRLGALAFLRNIRNMKQAGLSISTIREGLNKLNVSKVLPFQIAQVALYAPEFEKELEQLLFKSTEELKRLEGRTLLMIDVSGSMSCQLSEKSNLSRLDAAKTIAIILREICDDIAIYIFSEREEYVPSRNGFALADVIGGTRGCTNVLGSTYNAYKKVAEVGGDTIDRIVIITDEQENAYDCGDLSENEVTQKLIQTDVPAYIVNIGTDARGIMYKKNLRWTHVSGFSESIIKYISEMENRD